MMTSSNGNIFWLFVWGIHQSLVNSPHKGQWRGAFMFSLVCAWINGWVNNREAGDLRRHRIHYDVTVIKRVLLIFYHVTPLMSKHLFTIALEHQALHYSELDLVIRKLIWSICATTQVENYNLICFADHIRRCRSVHAMDVTNLFLVTVSKVYNHASVHSIQYALTNTCSL